MLEQLTGDAKRPYVVVLGGSKVSDKLAVIESLLPKVDKLLVGGGMCFTFLKAQGHEVGDSLLEEDQVENCARFLAEDGDKIVLPSDIVVAAEISADATTQTVAADAIPAGPEGSRHRPRDGRRVRRRARRRQTVFWNGPMGVFEVAPFAAGTRGVAEAVAARRRAVGRRRRRLRGRRARTRPRRERLRAHLDRRRRVAGVPRGQDAARRRRAGGE